jgi:hypothetical protein
MEGLLMAQPKRGKPGPKPDPEKARGETSMVRSGREWKEWATRLAAFDAEARRTNPSLSDTIDRALVSYAKEIGFGEPAPRR